MYLQLHRNLNRNFSTIPPFPRTHRTKICTRSVAINPQNVSTLRCFGDTSADNVGKGILYRNMNQELYLTSFLVIGNLYFLHLDMNHHKFTYAFCARIHKSVLLCKVGFRLPYNLYI